MYAFDFKNRVLHKLRCCYSYIFKTRYSRPLIVQTMKSVESNRLSLRISKFYTNRL